MHAIKSNVMGGVLGDMILPCRVGLAVDREQVLEFREATTPEFVLCHNDLGQRNIVVDEKTLEINAILDWEYAGFFPPEFEGAFYLRPGPSGALEGEEYDIPVLEVLRQWKA